MPGTPKTRTIQSLAWLLLLVPSTAMTAPLGVVTSILPMQTFVERVGGPHVEVQVMVRPGFDPHTYDPSPQQISALANAVLYVRTGMPFEDPWMDRIRSANPDMQVLDARSGIPLRAVQAHVHHNGGGDSGQRSTHAQPDKQHKHGQHEYEPDPHVWTSPPLAKRILGAIRTKLTELDPVHGPDYTRNHDAYASQIDDLDRGIRALLDPLPNRKFMVFHPAWSYFADTYRLVQVPVQHAGKEPGARSLAALVTQARKENIRVVFVQPQFNPRLATQLAREIGGSVVPVDPLAADYIDNLRRVAALFAKALTAP